MNEKTLKKILDIHFDREEGTPYWLERQHSLGFEVCRRIASMDDLYLLGEMNIEDMRTRPITAFIPRRFHGNLPSMLLSETGGTTGGPCRRVFSREEFDMAFIHPWLRAVEQCGFPHHGTWLFVGPGGPHIIDRSARAMARSVGSLEPFSVDCDVRWIKRQKKESIGFKLYLDHVLSQAMNIAGCQEIDTLFTTPPLLHALGERMSSDQRLRIRGIHSGGMSLTPEDEPVLASFFPNAVILPGYGNSLFGVTFPVNYHDLNTFHGGDGQRLVLQVAPLPKESGYRQDLRTHVSSGQRGRIICHCFDPTFLIINLAERDTAVSIDIGDGKKALSDIQPLTQAIQLSKEGVY